MSTGDPHFQAALDAARQHIAGAAAGAVADALVSLRALAAATPQSERAGIVQAQGQLLRSRAELLSAFDAALRDNVADDIAPKDADPAFRDPTDWKAVGLVGEEQIEEQLAFERVGQMIAHDCEAELRELSAYTGEMLDIGWADPARNPLRGNIVGAALTAAIDKVEGSAETRRCLVRELGQALARKLPAAYRTIVDDFAARGFTQADLAVRTTPSSPQPAGAASASGLEAMRELWERSMLGRMPFAAGGEAGAPGLAAAAGGPAGFGGVGTGTAAISASFLERLMQDAQGRPAADAFGPLPAIDVAALPVAAAGNSDAELMHLLRRLNESLASRQEAAPRFEVTAPVGLAEPAPRGGADSVAGEATPNLIRTHREELEKASTGQLDHMVIEVVASLFDQIFSDPRVAPQIGREIARLQLPVLRVALRDTTFFAARKHPVRRFINRISTLAGSFGELEHGPGRELLARISALVTEIVDGDFDQIAVYTRKLVELEAFNNELARAEFEASPAAATLHARENEWRLAQRFSGRMQEAIEPLPVADYLKTFLGETWSQVIVAASQGDAADPAREQRFRRAAFDLVASVQPKRSAEQRSLFIAGLRGLTATLNEGLASIGWPKEAHDAFFGRLMNEQAGSLKATPGSELDHNLLMRRLEAATKTPLPAAEDAATSQSATSGESLRFSARDAERVGLLDEAAVDWSTPAVAVGNTPRVDAAAPREAAAAAPIELDLDLATRPAPLDMAAPSSAAANAAPAGPAAAATPADAEPVEGPQLRHHLQIGVSYQLKLKQEWEKVRLTYMSPGRSFFLFAHGAKGRGTISMTSRMLERLCEARRIKAFETAPLFDRATERLRQPGAAAPAGVAASPSTPPTSPAPAPTATPLPA